MTATALSRSKLIPTVPVRPVGLGILVASEAFSAVVGFGVLVLMARTLGPREFAKVEFAAAIVAVLLVVVRSGIEAIVVREAARRPRLIGPLTDTLISLKLACALLAYSLLFVATAWSEARDMARVAGLLLFPSALIADVGPRARGSLGPIAFALAMRSLGLMAATFLLVRTTADALSASVCVALGESIAAIVLMVVHSQNYGIPRPRFRPRACGILIRRGAVASFSRLGRVFLYGADLLVLATFSRGELGPFAASRRVVFALVGLGLVVPAAFAPSIASAWTRGVEPAKSAIRSAHFGLMNLAVPAAIGLVLTAKGWMTAIFGPEYQAGGFLLALVAARAPFLLAAGLHHSSLVAIRRERESLQIIAFLIVLAGISLPISARSFGAVGVGFSMLGVEAVGTVAGWVRLHRRGIAPSIVPLGHGSILACVAMIATVLALGHQSVWTQSLAGAASFAGLRFALEGRPRS